MTLIKTHRIVPAVAMIGVLLTAGCDEPPVAVGPTPQPAPVAPASAVYLRGLVADTFGRPVPAALVEVVAGPLAGARRIADDGGQFEFTGTATAGSAVTLRVSKDGFETSSTTATWLTEPNARVFWTRLHPLDPPLGLGGGNYTLTLSFDVATAAGFPATPSRPEITCLGFPTDLASRTYDATITERPLGERDVRIKGSTVEPFADTFGMTVAGNVAAVNMEWSIGEAFPENRYLFIGGGPVPTQFTIDSGAVHLPFAADFRYCELSSARGIYNECSQIPLDRVVRQHWCRSDRVMMTFVKR